MEDERRRILEMLQNGKVTVEQAVELLQALDESRQADAAAAQAGTQGGPAAGPGGLAQLGRSIADSVGRAFGGVGGRANFSTARLTEAALSRMQDGTSYTNFGQLAVPEDVPAELLAQKIGSITNFGLVTAPEHLIAVLEERCEANFGSFERGGGEDQEQKEESSASRPSVENYGQNTLTQHDLVRMEDGTHYESYGELVLSDDLDADLLAQKITSYENYGTTVGLPHLLAVLKAHCENYGNFVEKTQTSGQNEDR